MPTTDTEDLLRPRLSPLTADNSRELAPIGGDPGDRTLVFGYAGAAPALAARLDALGLAGEDLLDTFTPSTDAASVTTIPLPPGQSPARRVLLVGLGAQHLEDFRAAGAAIGRAVRGRDEVIMSVPEAGEEAELTAYLEGFLLGGWGTPKWTAAGVVAGAEVAARVSVHTPLGQHVLDAARARVRATVTARCLGITPSNIKNPPWMAAQARTLARRSGCEVRVWNEKDLRKEGFGGLLAVGAASATPPRLVQVQWTPPGATARTPHIVLVGKGITFDTGGLDIKPAEGMLAMKTDMLGSAIVLAVLSACRDLGVSVKVTGLLALAENAVGGESYRPGDVVTQYGGTTVEIGNTDAEGRIVLADALAYADQVLDPDYLLDIATLTGAARVALGRESAPVFATDEALQSALIAAGETTGETLWPMPLASTYRDALESDVADLAHIGTGVGGGSIIAALFLREFVGERRWAHLDIAGTGRSDSDAGICGKGATGFGTRLLLRWLEGLT